MRFVLSLAAAALLGLPAPALADRNFSVIFSSKSVIEPGQEVPVAGLPDPTDPVTGSQALGNGIIAFDRRAKRADVKVTFGNLSGARSRPSTPTP